VKVCLPEEVIFFEGEARDVTLRYPWEHAVAEIHDIYFPEARGLEIHEVLSS
jgi:hypothetical protein